MHRHRRCTQLLQGYTALHGYDVPDFPGQPALTGSRVEAVYQDAMKMAFKAHRGLRGDVPPTNDAAESKVQAYSSAPVPVPEFKGDGLQMQWGSPLPSTSDAGESTSSQANPAADYLLPLSTRCRSLFSMDFAQAVYMSELRSTPAGHWSYRNVAWQMYQAVARQHPGLASHFRISDPSAPVDLLQR